jgi:hypothetical protein
MKKKISRPDAETGTTTALANTTAKQEFKGYLDMTIEEIWDIFSGRYQVEIYSEDPEDTLMIFTIPIGALFTGSMLHNSPYRFIEISLNERFGVCSYGVQDANNPNSLDTQHQPDTKMGEIIQKMLRETQEHYERYIDNIVKTIEASEEYVIERAWSPNEYNYLLNYSEYDIEYYLDDYENMHITAICGE